MRPGGKRTQVKSMNKDLRQGYVPEHKETGLRSRTKKKNTRLTKKRKAEPYNYTP